MDTVSLPNNTSVSVQSIFQEHWDSFLSRNASLVRPIEIEEVEKMLSCKSKKRGCFTYYCTHCDEYKFCTFGCNSRICSNCGKRHADQWAERLASNTFNVAHQHITLTIAEQLWSCLHEGRSALKVLMDSATQTLKEFFSDVFGEKVIPGCVVVLHPFGRNMGFKPHLHVIATKGGFDKHGHFKEWTRFIPFKKLHKKWMFVVCSNLKKHFPDTEEFVELFRLIWALYRETGFVVNVSKRPLKNHKDVARYIARYLRHPAVANSRITGADDTHVYFYYYCYKTGRRVDVIMPVEEFILAIIQHVPEKQFKMIRYYGAYSRNQKKKYKKYLQSSIRQKKLVHFVENKEVLCPTCKHPMEFVWYEPGKPPPEEATLLGFMG